MLRTTTVFREVVSFQRRIWQESCKKQKKFLHASTTSLRYATTTTKSTDKDDSDRAAHLLQGAKPIRMSDYTYNLLPESIAKYPASPRGSSKLLYCDQDGHVTYFPNFSTSITPLLKGKHVVFNESRVLDARLYVMGDAIDAVELMILDLGSRQIDLAASCESVALSAMIRLEHVKPGDVFAETTSGVEIEIVEVIGVWEEDAKSDGNGTECLVRIRSPVRLDAFLEANGNVPIPPYFHRAAEESDSESYNNVYAAAGGSVAAPTAGLHFTDKVLDEIGRKDNCSYLSLHVGAGTFKPVLVEDARQHAMHAETFAVSVHEIRNIVHALEKGKPLVVVGTTCLRTLESLYWSGVKRVRGQEIDCNDLRLEQFEWMPLLVDNRTSRVAALKSLLQGLDDDQVVRGATSLMITPASYKIQMADHLITNFHAPDSTLMLLVSAFLGSGSKVRQVYEDAQANGFRFLSYGDSCFFTLPK